MELAGMTFSVFPPCTVAMDTITKTYNATVGGLRNLAATHHRLIRLLLWLSGAVAIFLWRFLW
jgi:hypothetical protein